MEQKMLCRKNKKLIAACKEIFGDIVKSAYIISYDDRDAKDFGMEPRCFKNLSNESFIGPGELVDYGRFLIEFTNGKIVSFYSTESAIIKNHKIEEFENV